MANPTTFDALTDFGVRPVDDKPFAADLSKQEAKQTIVETGTAIRLESGDLLWAASAHTHSTKIEIKFSDGSEAGGAELKFELAQLYSGGVSVSGAHKITHIFCWSVP